MSNEKETAEQESPFDILLGHISNMKKKSDLYFAEAEEDEDFGEAEKHLRVSSVLTELERQGTLLKNNPCALE